jgi:hypothetical protein
MVYGVTWGSRVPRPIAIVFGLTSGVPSTVIVQVNLFDGRLANRACFIGQKLLARVRISLRNTIPKTTTLATLCSVCDRFGTKIIPPLGTPPFRAVRGHSL